MSDDLNFKKLIKISDFDQLSVICWNRDKDSFIKESEALSLYERNWKYADPSRIMEKEKEFIDHLISEYGNGVFNV